MAAVEGGEQQPAGPGAALKLCAGQPGWVFRLGPLVWSLAWLDRPGGLHFCPLPAGQQFLQEGAADNSFGAYRLG
jgi:hypothetical protein